LVLEGSELVARLSAGQSLKMVNSIIFDLLDLSDNTLSRFLVVHFICFSGWTAETFSPKSFL